MSVNAWLQQLLHQRYNSRMRTGVLLGTMLVLATMAVGEQTATGIHLVDVRFNGDTHLPDVDLSKCAGDLKSQIYEGPEWLAHIADRVQLLCLQENGYFKAAVKASAEQLHDKHGTHQFVVTFTIDSGPQYRTGQIGFRNNRLFSEEELRSMFNIGSGEVFRITKVRMGLDQIQVHTSTGATWISRHFQTQPSTTRCMSLASSLTAMRASSLDSSPDC
jgi:outer membrane translocation and assembly module TamA